MLLEMPLLSGWTLTADELREAEEPVKRPEGFSLPGALELKEFADLLGLEEEEEHEKHSTWYEHQSGVRPSFDGTDSASPRDGLRIFFCALEAGNRSDSSSAGILGLRFDLSVRARSD
jgi:hypothetical protein